VSVRFLEAARNDLREAIRDQPRNPPKSTEKRIRINFPVPCPFRARFNDGRLRVTTEAQLRARARFVFSGHWPL